MLKKIQLEKLAIWACSYLSIVSFAIVGGWAYVKSESDNLKKTTKNALVIMLIFIAFDLLIAFINAVGGMFTGYWVSKFYDFISTLVKIASIAEIGAYIAFVVWDVFVQKKQD